MKIDVEGAGLEVRAGAMDTISRCRPTALVQVHWRSSQLLDFLDKQLAPIGYRVTSLDGRALPRDPMRLHVVVRCPWRRPARSGDPKERVLDQLAPVHGPDCWL